MSLIQNLKNKVLSGYELTEDEAFALARADGGRELLDAAAEITAHFAPRKFDSCSIVNARSGRCSENCKWCAQSAHFNTHCAEYEVVDEKECLKAARYNHEKGVGRFSLVASGRSVRGRALDEMCRLLREINDTGISTCASMGLLSRDELLQLYAAGTRRYHCNLETSPSMFATLCTTHAISDKLETIRNAKEIGFEICSGGIIGMGETRDQRVELALTLRQVSPVSIPLNILSPIKGTPLGDTPLISEDEVLETIALFRFIHPGVVLRFAGGRSRLSENTQREALRVGINGAIVGDLLTTIGSTIDDDRRRVTDMGYDF